MGRMVLRGLVVCASLAGPAFTQTNEACMLRCLDHGNLDQTCQARCTKGVPPAEAPKPRHSEAPANAPAASVPQSPAAASSPPPAAAPSAPQRPEDQAPLQPTVQASPQQSLKPPRPVNEACVLRCLDHGHLDQYCDRICAR